MPDAPLAAPDGPFAVDCAPPFLTARFAAPQRTLFIYQQIAPHTARVITAAKASLNGPDREGRIILDLNDFSSHTFADAHPLVGLSKAETNNAAILSALKEVPQITMHVRDMSRLMMVNQLLPFTSLAGRQMHWPNGWKASAMAGCLVIDRCRAFQGVLRSACHCQHTTQRFRWEGMHSCLRTCSRWRRKRCPPALPRMGGGSPRAQFPPSARQPGSRGAHRAA